MLYYLDHMLHFQQQESIYFYNLNEGLQLHDVKMNPLHHIFNMRLKLINRDD
ncbi:unnamed protein product [Schistosoma curassoni]|uniref:Uncharacterized protein n=1 Tax=Schistosoma curassoni TaxID=6186 RepID=A0A183JNR8_9TREM|nr:unnamed protein product [Schistosoma curassoni]